MATTRMDVTQEAYNQLVRDTHEYVLRSFPPFGANLTDEEAALLIQSWLEDSILRIEHNFYNDGMLRGWCYKILIEEVRNHIGIDLTDALIGMADSLGYGKGTIGRIMRNADPALKFYTEVGKEWVASAHFGHSRIDYSDILKPEPVRVELDVTKCKS